METNKKIIKYQENRPISKLDAKPEEVANYYENCFTTVFGIDDAISILNVLSVKAETTAGDVRMIEFEIGDLRSKKARVFALLHAFMANKRAMRPPTEEMITSAKKLAKVLDKMIATNATADQIIVTATQLFKIWQKTEG